jgi:hypothetical protein
VLVFRLQRGLPTILQFRPGKLFYFSESGVHEFSYQENSNPTPFRDTIDSSTWCLVDTNLNLGTVPTFLTLLRTFIVQASSPRDARTKWDSKYGSAVIRYYMAPWSISEIITGYVSALLWNCSRLIQRNSAGGFRGALFLRRASKTFISNLALQPAKHIQMVPLRYHTRKR